MVDERKTYKLSAAEVNLVIGSFFVFFIWFVWALWFYRPQQLPGAQKFFALFFFAPWFLLGLGLKRFRVQVDGAGIAYTTYLSTTEIKWNELIDFIRSDRLIVLRDSKGQRIKFFQADFLSIRPFEDLRETIQKYAMPRVQAHWRETSDRLVLSYPPLSLLTLGAYTLSFVLLASFLIFPAVCLAGSFGFAVVGLAAGLLVIAPFLVRDIRNTKRTLLLTDSGLVCRSGRNDLEMKWSDIDRIIVKEPMTIGYGRVVVVSRTGNKISIPRSIKRYGQIDYILRTKTGMEPAQSFDY